MDRRIRDRHQTEKWKYVLAAGGLGLAIWMGCRNSLVELDLNRPLATGVGNGESYSGGDTVDGQLATARQTLMQALTHVKFGKDVQTLCTMEGCQAGDNPTLCYVVQSLSLPQREACREFIQNVADQMTRLAEPSTTLFSISEAPLTVREPSGTLRPVSALTQAAAQAPVAFHHASIKNLPQSGLIALITHEFGHKVKIAVENRQSIDDNHAFGPFTRGRDLLDAVGAAMGIYAMTHRTPVQDPPSLPEGVKLGAACSIAKDNEASFLLGVSVDVERSPLPAEKLLEWKRVLAAGGRDAAMSRFRFVQHLLSGERARAISVSSLYNKFLLRAPSTKETTRTLARLQQGTPYDLLVAELITSAEYRAERGKLTAQQFLHEMHLDLLGRAATDQEVEELSRKLSYMNRLTLVRAVLNQNEEAMNYLVGSWFQEYLNRHPTVVESQSHVMRVKAGVSWETVRAFVLSTAEYRSLQGNRFHSATGGVCVTSAAQAN